MIMFGFTNLTVYQQAMDLVEQVYLLLKRFPREEQYALCDQLRRAVVSVPSNIAEGLGHLSPKEQAHYMEIAYSSLMETYCQLTISLRLQYIPLPEYDSMTEQIENTAKMLSGLRRSLLRVDR